jgi:acylphosphatase
MKGTILAVLTLAVAAAAQTSYPPPPPGRQAAPAQRTAAAPAPANPVNPTTAQVDPNQVLAQLGQASNALNSTLEQLRIEKWKTGSQEKSQLQSNADSIRRNVTAALPGMVQDVRNAPDNLAPSFKLYRNVGALYDVLASLTEAAGAFGPKDDFRDLSQELQQIDGARHNLADRVEQLASAKDAEVSRLAAQLKQAQAALPPKKIVVDNSEEEKPKPKKKKKPASTTAQPAAQPQE